MRIAIVFLVLILAAFIAEGQSTISYGVKAAEIDSGFVIRDFSNMSFLSRDMFGMERYGFGSGHLELTNRPQMKAENRSGVLLGFGDLRMGLELANGYISYQNRPDYEWSPALSIGPKIDLGLIGFYFGPRAGLTYRKQEGGNDSFTGAVASVEFFRSLTATYYVDNYFSNRDRLEISSVTILNKVNFERQTRTRTGDTWIFSMRFDN